MINIIDRYIAKLFLGFFFGGLIIFVTLFVSVDFMTNIGREGAANSVVLRYYILSLPAILYQMLPVACLLGTIFTLGSLSRNNELVALFSSGMSLARVSAPILALVVAISAAGFFLNDRIGPKANQRKNYTYFVLIKNQPGLYSTVKTDRIWYRSGNVIFNIQTLQAEKAKAQGLSMYFMDQKWRLIQMITADSVKMIGNKWELSSGTLTLFTQDSTVPLTQSFKTKTIPVSQDIADLQKSAQTSDALSVNELKRFITRNKESGLDTLRYEVDYHAKFSFAFAAFVMSFLGIPFSVGKQRSGGAAFGVGVTILLAFLYWSAYSSGITLGQHGALPPVVAVWVPNLVMLGLSFVFLNRLKR